MNTKKSSGFDGISNFLIKKFPDATLRFLVLLYNNCLNNCYFPTVWTTTKIIPIKKKTDSSKIEDFRPISLLSNVGKIFEHVIKIKLENEFIFDPVSSFQFGFKRYQSTQHTLVKLHSDVVHHLRQRKCTVAISLDIEKVV
mgnify:CR=1 FL=1